MVDCKDCNSSRSKLVAASPVLAARSLAVSPAARAVSECLLRAPLPAVLWRLDRQLGLPGFIASEIAKWRTIIKQAAIRLE